MKTFLPLIDSNISLEEILNYNKDGTLKGNLLEFKLCINDLNRVFHCVKYLSALIIKDFNAALNLANYIE